MPIAQLLAPVLAFLLREVVVKFVVMAAIFIAVSELMPLVLGFVAPFILPGSLTSAFSAISAGVWFFLDLARLDYGLPLMISAYIARFSVRRVPVVG